MEYFLKIGEVCRLYGITPDTLRHYEKKGLIHPWRDPTSGYRYYSVAQLDVIDLILAAKTIGIPLAEIRRVIASEDVASYRAMYETQQRLLEEKIASLSKLLAVTKEKRATLSALVASGQCAVKKLPPDFFAQRFWGNDAALVDCLTARREALFYARTRYSLLRGDGRHEHFVDIFVPASSSLS